ncbi:hypothetical protein Q3G72_032082 [Acer saccharum]|nr:hypothetical protein Q3G72_032082 [Acer saccharum]
MLQRITASVLKLGSRRLPRLPLQGNGTEAAASPGVEEIPASTARGGAVEAEGTCSLKSLKFYSIWSSSRLQLKKYKHRTQIQDLTQTLINAVHSFLDISVFVLVLFGYLHTQE